MEGGLLLVAPKVQGVNHLHGILALLGEVCPGVCDSDLFFDFIKVSASLIVSAVCQQPLLQLGEIVAAHSALRTWKDGRPLRTVSPSMISSMIQDAECSSSTRARSSNIVCS